MTLINLSLGKEDYDRVFAIRAGLLGLTLTYKKHLFHYKKKYLTFNIEFLGRQIEWDVT